MRTFLFARLVVGACVAIGLTACGSDADDNACLDLAMEECACCDAAQVEPCKQAAREANDREPPPDEGLSLCRASLDSFTSCADLSPQKLKPICDGTAFK